MRGRQLRLLAADPVKIVSTRELQLQTSIQPHKEMPYRLKGVSFGGAGIFFWWELGCVLWLLEHIDVDTCPFFGASGGALAATFTACKVDPFEAFRVANRLADEHRIFDRPLGVAGIWGNLIRTWLDELLPDDAAEICRDRVSIVVTTLPKLELKSFSDFDSKEDLIDINMASAHIPFFLDGKFANKIRGLECIDGSLHDFLSGSNSEILTCKGSTLLFDYFDDEHLNYSRLDFMSLKKPKEVVNMIHLGYEHAERLSKTENFQKAVLHKPKRSFFLQNSSIPWRR